MEVLLQKLADGHLLTASELALLEDQDDDGGAKPMASCSARCSKVRQDTCWRRRRWSCSSVSRRVRHRRGGELIGRAAGYEQLRAIFDRFDADRSGAVVEEMRHVRGRPDHAANRLT